MGWQCQKRASWHYCPEFRVPRSDSSVNFGGDLEDASRAPGNFGSRTYTEHHNNQVPNDQFAVNRHDINPPSRHVSNDNLELALTLGNNYTRGANYARARMPRLHQSSSHPGVQANYARGRMPIVHQSSSHSGASYARGRMPRMHQTSSHSAASYACGRMPRMNQTSSHSTIQANYARGRMPSLHLSSSQSGMHDNYARGRMPVLHQSSSHSGASYARGRMPSLHQSSTQSGMQAGYARGRMPILHQSSTQSRMQAGYARGRMPILHQSPVHSQANHARGRMPRLHQSTAHPGREVAEQENRQRRRNCPLLISPIHNGVYDPGYAANGQPVDPFLRLFQQNPTFVRHAKCGK